MRFVAVKAVPPSFLASRKSRTPALAARGLASSSPFIAFTITITIIAFKSEQPLRSSSVTIVCFSLEGWDFSSVSSNCHSERMKSHHRIFYRMCDKLQPQKIFPHHHHVVRSSDGFPGKAESSLANLEREVSTQIFS